MDRPKFFKEWLPENLQRMEPWHAHVREKAAVDNEMLPVMREFQELIDADPVVRMAMSRMISQIPLGKYPNYHPKDTAELLSWLNAVLTTAPYFADNMVVGTPLSALLMWTMGVPAGFEAYRNAKINAMFKKVLAAWTAYLDSPESRYVLNTGFFGWQSPPAMKKLQMQDYQYDPKAPYWGFKSWNDFFTRPLAPNARPIAEPNNNKVIVSACDSQVYAIEPNVKLYSKFWLKTQPHSLIDMLGAASKQWAPSFEGGTVYQAFLNPFNYHRWHSPVSGTIKVAFVQEGLYFSQADSEGEDPTIQDQSEGYITQVQTRAVIIIEADDPVIGPVCVMPVGMVEISSCKIRDTIKPGVHVSKGQELGYFQFGGSTHCVIFRPGATKQIVPKVGNKVRMGQPIAVAN